MRLIQQAPSNDRQTSYDDWNLEEAVGRAVPSITSAVRKCFQAFAFIKSTERWTCSVVIATKSKRCGMPPICLFFWTPWIEGIPLSVQSTQWMNPQIKRWDVDTKIWITLTQFKKDLGEIHHEIVIIFTRVSNIMESYFQYLMGFHIWLVLWTPKNLNRGWNFGSFR